MENSTRNLTLVSHAAAGVHLERAELAGGTWKTIRGAHVYVRDSDGVIIAGAAKHLHGKTEAQAAAHGKAPAEKREGFYAIQRNAKGDYEGTKGAGGTVAHVAEHAERMASHKLPPGWTDVHLSEDPHAKLQALGKDEKGRTQYRYSTEHSGEAAAAKWARTKALVAKLPELDAAIKDHPSEEAAVLRLVRETGFRIGSDADTGAEKQAYGATTLRKEHVRQEGGKTVAAFTGKKGVDIRQEIAHPGVAQELTERAARANAGGKLYNTTDAKVRDFLHGIVPEAKVKDLRTIVAADTALRAIKDIPAPTDAKGYEKARLEVGRRAAAKLGNTPTVALASYVSPEVFSGWRSRLANREQADLIEQYAKEKGVAADAAAKEWIPQHAKAFRQDFNERYSGKAKATGPDPNQYGIAGAGGHGQLRSRAAKSAVAKDGGARPRRAARGGVAAHAVALSRWQSHAAQEINLSRRTEGPIHFVTIDGEVRPFPGEAGGTSDRRDPKKARAIAEKIYGRGKSADSPGMRRVREQLRALNEGKAGSGHPLLKSHAAAESHANPELKSHAAASVTAKTRAAYDQAAAAPAKYGPGNPYTPREFKPGELKTNAEIDAANAKRAADPRYKPGGAGFEGHKGLTFKSNAAAGVTASHAELQGSEKQVAWAKDIRAKRLAEVAAIRGRLESTASPNVTEEDKTVGRAVLDDVHARIAGESSAKAHIDNRDKPTGEIVSEAHARMFPAHRAADVAKKAAAVKSRQDAADRATRERSAKHAAEESKRVGAATKEKAAAEAALAAFKPDASTAALSGKDFTVTSASGAVAKGYVEDGDWHVYEVAGTTVNSDHPAAKAIAKAARESATATKSAATPKAAMALKSNAAKAPAGPAAMPADDYDFSARVHGVAKAVAASGVAAGANHAGDAARIDAVHAAYEKQYGPVPLDAFKARLARLNGEAQGLPLVHEDHPPSYAQHLGDPHAAFARAATGPAAYPSHYVRADDESAPKPPPGRIAAKAPTPAAARAQDRAGAHYRNRAGRRY